MVFGFDLMLVLELFKIFLDANVLRLFSQQAIRDSLYSFVFSLLLLEFLVQPKNHCIGFSQVL